jgi:hypothetical protein
MAGRAIAAHEVRHDRAHSRAARIVTQSTSNSCIPSKVNCIMSSRPVLCVLGALLWIATAHAGEPGPQTPAAFLPGGMLGVQLGSSWELSKKSPSLEQFSCHPIDDDAKDFDEVCFFRTSNTSRVAGAEIHDGFMVRKGDHVVLIGTGIAIKNADDPLAEAVMQSFRSSVHSVFQHTGTEVLFMKLPEKRMSPEELLSYSQEAPVLLVQLEPKDNELAVFYGYLAPVNVFGALTSN